MCCHELCQFKAVELKNENKVAGLISGILNNQAQMPGRKNYMKTAVIYYSMDGNTKFAAEKIATRLSADVIQITPIKEYPTGKVSKYFWGGKSATFGESPKLEAYDFVQNQYDMVILGTPIWAGTFAPPLRTFIRENKLMGKKIALFACCSGGATEKCFEQLKKETGNSTVLSTLRLIDPLKGNQAEVDKQIVEFCVTLESNQL